MNMQDELSANILGTAIEHERIDKGLTREELAERIGYASRISWGNTRGQHPNDATLLPYSM